MAIIYEVWAHGPSGQCRRVSEHDNARDASNECARLNEEEQSDGRGASGWYHVVDSRPGKNE